MSQKLFCFVLMPFSAKKDPASGVTIDFDQIYDSAIRPGIEAAGLEPIRADEERTGGIIHKPMFERLMLCEYAVADLTTASANVFYELGVRHAVRPATTLPIYASGRRLPFNIAFLRALPYRLGPGNHFGDDEKSRLRADLTRRLEELKALNQQGVTPDSPVFQLLENWKPDIKHLKTDLFRERTRYEVEIKRKLAAARQSGKADELHRIESDLGDLTEAGAGVVVDLFLSYRAVEDHQGMVDLYQKMPAELRNTVMIREQLGFALNRLGRREEATEVLESILSEQGPSSETCGLLGRVYKDRWSDAAKRGEDLRAGGYLDQAVLMYRRGYEADIRDAYPGVNAVTLLEIRGDEESLSLKNELLPVVRFAARQRLQSPRPDYWDYATLLELAVLSHDQQAAKKWLARALAQIREVWEPKTTANNLRLIRESRTARGRAEDWLQELINALNHAAAT